MSRSLPGTGGAGGAWAPAGVPAAAVARTVPVAIRNPRRDSASSVMRDMSPLPTNPWCCAPNDSPPAPFFHPFGRLRRISVEMDERTFERLAQDYAGRLYAVAYRMLGHRADAEDAVQRALLK